MSSMSKLTIKPNKPYAAKRKLCKLADSDDSDTDMAYVPLPHSSNDEDEMPVPPKKKRKVKNIRKTKFEILTLVLFCRYYIFCI